MTKPIINLTRGMPPPEVFPAEDLIQCGEAALRRDPPDHRAVFDEAVFSCDVGLNKPDPRFYEITCQRLGVRPEECLYIGDGSSHELTGAASVGMHPVLIRVPYEDTPDALRIREEEWDGPRISSLTEVLTLLE